MKYCAIICEYNPFHNGHKYQLGEIRRQSGCDGVLCLMSGNFTQRGDAAVFDKFTRAAHAVEGGADVVLELPAAFAVSSAENFAYGAVRILASLPCVSRLAFGCESGTKEDFLRTARATLNESKQFKAALKENMKDGTSYVRARSAALIASGADVDEALLTSPNNILGTEYCRAILKENAAIDPLPIPRVGGGYADTALFRDFSSATALRGAIADGSRKAKKALKNNLPPHVYAAALHAAPFPYGQAALCALTAASEEQIARCPDCAEGLENRLKAMAHSNPCYEEALKKVVSKRYTLSRLKRILSENFLGITRDMVQTFSAAPLYYKTLAVRSDKAEEILKDLSQGAFPALVRKSDYSALSKTARACFALDVRANDLYNVLTQKHTNEYETLFV